MIVGATNRPNDVDKAILRRMPRTFRIGLPNRSQRESILRALLRNENIEGGYDLAAVAAATEGYSGNDLQELCRNAAMTAMTDSLRKRLSAEKGKEGADGGDAKTAAANTTIRLTTADFLAARVAVEGSLCESELDRDESGVDDDVPLVDRLE